jgi:hypothetical protein
MDNFKDDIKKFIPGFTMGITRAIISHPFEMLKLKSQMNIKKNFYSGLYKGVHLSIFSNALERGIQFYWFEEFKKKYSNNFYSSFLASLISTSITLPYNIILLRKTLLNETNKLNKINVYKSGLLEYSRNISGSTIFLYSYNYFRTDKYPIYFASIISSFIVWGITYPIDNIKNQIIANKKIVYDIKLMYRGIQYPLLRSIPSSTIGFYVYEYLNNLLNKKIKDL